MTKLRASDLLKYPDGVYGDGNGLYLAVLGESRLWFFRTTSNGKRTKKCLGPLKHVSLAQARQKVLQLKLEGIKPVKKKLFKDFYLEAVEHVAKIKQWKNKKSFSQWKNTIETYAVPVIGNKLAASISTKDIKEVLDPIYETKTETASRVAGSLKAVLITLK